MNVNSQPLEMAFGSTACGCGAERSAAAVEPALSAKRASVDANSGEVEERRAFSPHQPRRLIS